MIVINLKNRNSYPVRGLSKEIIQLSHGGYTPSAWPDLLDSKVRAELLSLPQPKNSLTTYRPTKQVERNQRMQLRSIILLITWLHSLLAFTASLRNTALVRGECRKYTELIIRPVKPSFYVRLFVCCSSLALPRILKLGSALPVVHNSPITGCRGETV